MSESFPVRLRVICVNPPAFEHDDVPVEFGLQDKQGRLQAGTPRDDKALIYECDAKVAINEGKPNFTGSAVHGTPEERFLYMSVRRVDAPGWMYRSKIMLYGISLEMAKAATQGVLEIVVDGISVPRANVVQGWQATAE